ncbi:MAG TPA: GspE/PulE family protein [Planctomycetaceae bacterium]|jgi:type II secretory ATPase GspE/PulE/Tfp pilus assembly ATPase PilB-like protein|nr:GspE/PulE family protein [Planctomycetaceae bacterium]
MLSVILVALVVAPRAADAQSSKSSDSATKSTAKTDTTPAVGAVASPERFPPNPVAFYRGNAPENQEGGSGEYLSRIALILFLGLFAGWVGISRFVDEDSRGLRVRPEFWNSVIVVTGVVGFLIALASPLYLVGALSVLLTCGVPFGFYVQERNRRVPESGKILTRQHIRSVAVRLATRLGIRLGQGGSSDASSGPPIEFIGKSDASGKGDRSRTRQVESSKGYMAAKELVYDAILRRSTDIHLEPKEDEMSVRLRIDGVMYPTEPFDRVVGDAVMNIFKVLGGMDITEKRRGQDGSFGAKLEQRQIDFRAATQGTRHGEKLSLRILDQSSSVNSLAGLGMRKKMQESMRQIVHQPHGLLLSCGPTGAGKSTTLYASLKDVDAYQLNVITVEDPIEYKMANVNQIEINTKSGQTFATSLRSILRQDPDVLLIGEIRDGETATIACQAANTGHMVFSTVHANDSITAVYRMLELGVEPFMVANSLSAVLGQRLVRRLCKECREAYKPERAVLERLEIPADRIDQFFRPPGSSAAMCPECNGLGYVGRTGVFELLVINDELRDLIRDKAAASKVKLAAKRNGMLTMKQEGIRLLAQGITSVEELERTVK